jgi:ankyrin repeat protein
MDDACYDGFVGKVEKLLDAGESVNSVNDLGQTPIMSALMYNDLHIFQVLADRGAALTMVSNKKANLLHYAAYSGYPECINWVLANTTIDINSTTTEGITPIMFSLMRNELNGAKFLVEKGANLFMKNKDGERAIGIHVINDPAIVLGPQVLQHAKDIRWSSVKQLLLLSKAYESADVVSSSTNHLATSVFSIEGLVRRIASFFINKKLIVKDPAIKKEDEEPDDVRRRIEAALAADQEKNRRTRKG